MSIRRYLIGYDQATDKPVLQVPLSDRQAVALRTVVPPYDGDPDLTETYPLDPAQAAEALAIAGGPSPQTALEFFLQTFDDADQPAPVQADRVLHTPAISPT